MAKFIFSDSYNKNLERIEDYILEAAESIDAVSEFLDQPQSVRNVFFITANNEKKCQFNFETFQNPGSESEYCTEYRTEFRILLTVF